MQGEAKNEQYHDNKHETTDSSNTKRTKNSFSNFADTHAQRNATSEETRGKPVKRKEPAPTAMHMAELPMSKSACPNAQIEPAHTLLQVDVSKV